MSDLYQGYGPRPPVLPLKRGAVDFTDRDGLAAMGQVIGDAPLPPVEQTADDPFVGITTDGRPEPGLFPLRDEGARGDRAADAARAYLGGLTARQQSLATFPIHAREWRLWVNAFLTFPEHGLQLQELQPDQRDAALAVIEASLSPEGYAAARQAMRLNAALGDFIGAYADTLTEYAYWFSIFGDPSADGPWGWQLQGHHVDLHVLFLGGQLVVTPAFLGTEFQGDSLFGEHRDRARELMTSLDTAQRDRALLYGSMLSAELPAELAGIVDGRHRAGAGRDNLVLPSEGLPGDALSAGQRELLRALIDPYLANIPETPRAHRRAQIERHLDQTYLAWIGTWDEKAPFYYRLHSPVLLVEYDNHAGILLDNDEPEPFHVHTIVRTPNGGDYGKDLLRQHYASHRH